MNDNKKLLYAAAGAVGALVTLTATLFAVKLYRKKQNAMLLDDFDCSLDDDIAEFANEVEETKANEISETTTPKGNEKLSAEENCEDKTEPTTEEFEFSSKQNNDIEE